MLKIFSFQQSDSINIVQGNLLDFLFHFPLRYLEKMNLETTILGIRVDFLFFFFSNHLKPWLSTPLVDSSIGFELDIRTTWMGQIVRLWPKTSQWSHLLRIYLKFTYLLTKIHTYNYHLIRFIHRWWGSHCEFEWIVRLKKIIFFYINIDFYLQRTQKFNFWYIHFYFWQ